MCQNKYINVLKLCNLLFVGNAKVKSFSFGELMGEVTVRRRHETKSALGGPGGVGAMFQPRERLRP